MLRVQIKLSEWNNRLLQGIDSNGIVQRISLPTAKCYAELPSLLKKGCTLNLLSCTTDEEGILHPKNIILSPDYLIDISALARCVQTYGSPAIGYILNMFEKSEDSAARLLGEAANMFLDDCINETETSPAEYNRSMEKFFREYPLQLSVCEEIDKKFFASTHIQFQNIQQRMGACSIDNEQRNYMQLEPSFFCEPLGLQGRIDLLQNDYSMLVELKSGKADEFNSRAKEEHSLQMALYKEMLSYCLQIPRDKINARLFYSRYPCFFSEKNSNTAISNALMLRNKIVVLLEKMCIDGLRNELENLSPDDLNESGTTSQLWNKYQRPRIEAIIAPIKNSDTLLREYFFGNVAFVAREMSLAKTGGIQRDNRHGFSDVWKSSAEEKLQEGNILIDLQIEELIENEGISDITLHIPDYSESFFPNFRAGDTVFIYRRENNSDSAVNRQVTRCTLTEIAGRKITLHLRHKQRNRNIFPKNGKYALEHDHLDSTFRSTFCDLYCLLTAPRKRIDLLLTRTRPTFDTTRTLNGDYGNEYINNIVLKAKQANELFMLVGPPGTGKTSQALSSMIREFYTDKQSNILLASYTNRAVDEICQALEKLPEHPDYLRIGSEQSCQPQYRKRLLKNVTGNCKNRELIRNLINDTRITVGTIASLTARKELFRLKKFHIAIIDEATQVLESQLSGLLAATSPDGTSAIEKFILIGDPKQLPAVVTQPAAASTVQNKILRNIGITDHATSLFERFYRHYYHSTFEGLIATLNKQGRMHPDVGNFANKHFYHGTLHCIPLPHQEEKLQYMKIEANDFYQHLLATRRTAFIATQKPNENENIKTNRHEAKEIALFTQAYYRLRTSNGYTCNPSDEIGIIVPFRNQIAMITNEIASLGIPDSNNIIIDTVERFQGSQREIIFFGTTISQISQMDTLSQPITDADGEIIDRKLNVALTRARRQMLVFGNPEILVRSPIYSRLMKELNQQP